MPPSAHDPNGGGRKAPFTITYEETDHQYAIDGRSVPSITQVTSQLADFSMISDEVLARAGARGTLIHKACELEAQGILDPSSIDDSIVDDVAAFATWKSQTRFRPIFIEEIVGSKRFGYAGRLDLFGRIGRDHVLVDIKSGVQLPAHSVQVAGQEIALREYMGLPSIKIERACLYLKDGKYRYEIHRDPQDTSVFLAALQVSHYRRKNL